MGDKLRLRPEILFLFCLICIALWSCDELTRGQKTAIHKEAIPKNTTATSKNEEMKRPDTIAFSSPKSIAPIVKNIDTTSQAEPFPRGIRQEGHYKIYDQVVVYGDDDDCYKGPPKVEVLDAYGEVLKTIYVLNNTQLFGADSVDLFFTEEITNAFDVKFEDNSRLTNYFDTLHFFKPPFEMDKLDSGTEGKIYFPYPMMLIQYRISHGVLLCEYTYLTLDDTELYGGGGEIVAIDSLGNELGRVLVDGPVSLSGVTIDHEMLYIRTGGQMTEDGYHFTGFWAYSFLQKQIFYSRLEKENQCVTGGWAKGNKGFMSIRKRCNSRKSTTEVFVFDHIESKVYSMHLLENCLGGGFQFKEEYFLCYSKTGEKQKFYYKEAFQAEGFIK